MSDKVAKFDRNVARALAAESTTDVVQRHERLLHEVRAKFVILEGVFAGIARDLEAVEDRCAALEAQYAMLVRRLEPLEDDSWRAWVRRKLGRR